MTASGTSQLSAPHLRKPRVHLIRTGAADNPFDTISRTAEEARRKIEEDLEARRKTMNPLMKKVNIMRTEMCWARPNLMEHKPCLKFLGIVCSKERTGLGICHKFKKKVHKACADTSSPLKALYCELDEDFDEHDEDHEQDLDEHVEDHEQADEEDTVNRADTDGDGVVDSKDAFPEDPKESLDTDGDGVGDNSDPDIDGDGIKNAKDKFPKDPTEWKDSDGDGVGDNSDEDIDGDEITNANDKFPHDKTRWADTDDDGISDNSDEDIDGDGVTNEDDAFPKDKSRWGDIGDDDADMDDHDEEAIEVANGGVDNLKGHGNINPDDLNKEVGDGQPPQGYNEYGPGPVKHIDMETESQDWGGEWPMQDESEKESISRICKEHPNNSWCRRYKKHGQFAR